MPRMRRLIALIAASISICAQETQPAAPRESQPTPRLVLSKDDTEIGESCIIEIPAGYVVADANTNGVIRVTADDIRIRFIGELRGATNGTPWDMLRGVGIRIDNAKIRGFKNGILANRADGLMITDCDFTDNYRQHLKSTREAESGDDWLFPHHNDKRKW